MVNYRRNFVPGGTYFFTVALHDRRARLLTEHVAKLREAFRGVLRDRPFHIEGIVVLPDHLHTVWTLPPDDADYPGRWKAMKSAFTRSLQKTGHPVPMRRDGSALVWQRHYWEHTIRDSDDLRRHIDYLHFNPVKHGWVERVADWPYSSFHRYVRDGLLPEHWGAGCAPEPEIGEPEFGE